MAHVKNMMLSPRANVKWIIRNRKEEAEKFVKDFNLSARCTTPNQLDSVYNDPEYVPSVFHFIYLFPILQKEP